MFVLEDSYFYFVGKRYYLKSVLDSYRKQITSILDIGCGTGGQTKFLGGYGPIIGVEPNPIARRLAKKRGLTVLSGEVQKLPRMTKKFDLVSLLDVLYHEKVTNVSQAIKQTKKVLKKNGLLLITDSAFPWLKSSHDKVMHGARRFEINELKQILKIQGFVVIKASYTYFTLFPLVIIKRLFLKTLGSDVKALPFILNQVFKGILFWESRLLRFTNFPWGSSLIILSKRKN